VIKRFIVAHPTGTVRGLLVLGAGLALWRMYSEMSITLGFIAVVLVCCAGAVEEVS
jgi:hypothetical protein